MKQPYHLVEKVCFIKKVLVLNPYPQTPFPRKGAILLGLPPLDPVGGYAPATPFLSTIEVYRQSEIRLFCETAVFYESSYRKNQCFFATLLAFEMQFTGQTVAQR